MTRYNADETGPLALAIDIPLWLEHDTAVPFRDRHERDRGRLGDRGQQLIELTDGQKRSAALIRHWWSAAPVSANETHSAGTDVTLPGARVQRLRGLITLVLLVAGLLVGSGLATAVLQYDGTHPINTVTAVAVLALLPGVLALLSAFLMLPKIGGLGWLRDAISTINIGVMASGAMRRFGARQGEWSTALGWHGARVGAAHGFAKWQALTWSHTVALAFSVGAIATSALMVVFTDLAFGWSTTLDTEPAGLHRLAQWLSLPWHIWLPDAMPTLQLVEQTRYFRFDGGQVASTAGPVSLSGWWPFLLMAMLTYSVLPRLLLLVVSLVRLRRETRTLLVDDPRVRALLDRLTTPVVSTHTGARDPGPKRPSTDQAPQLQVAAPDVDDALVICWAQAVVPEAAAAWLRARLAVPFSEVALAGGARSVAEDLALIQQVPQKAYSRAIVLAKAWEPPMLELIDFVEDLRGALGSGVSIMLVPVAQSLEGAPTPRDVAIWERAIGGIADPQVYVQALIEQPSTRASAGAPEA